MNYKRSTTDDTLTAFRSLMMPVCSFCFYDVSTDTLPFFLWAEIFSTLKYHCRKSGWTAEWDGSYAGVLWYLVGVEENGGICSWSSLATSYVLL